MEEYLRHTDFNKYVTEIAGGEAVFREGDDSRDLYFLVDGALDIFKGNSKISSLCQSGQVFGEMSYLLGKRRSATVTANGPVKLIKVPGDRITEFLEEFPVIAPEITRVLAGRLQETTDVMHGLEEFCDQVPDAVVMLDIHQHIQAWNKAAETLYGRPLNQVRDHRFGELFDDQAEYQQFIQEVADTHSLAGREIGINHPGKGLVIVSVSSKTLYDVHRNVRGYVLLGRDVTSDCEIKRSYLVIKSWLIPAILLVTLLAGVVFATYPKFTKGSQILSHREASFKQQLENDFLRMSRLLGASLETRDQDLMEKFFRDYFRDDEPQQFAITGLLVLDRDKNVIAAFSGNPAASSDELVGTSYKGFHFDGKEKTRHHVLTLFRATTENPMGEKGVELVFPLNGPQEKGWLVFQLDMERLAREFGLEIKQLQRINFLDSEK